MLAYTYRADIYCPDCAGKIQQELDTRAKWVRKASYPVAWSGASDVYPSGPHASGGGEADCPQHCGACGVFLENPLTDEGDDYVRAAVEALTAPGTSDETWDDVARRIEAMGSTPKGNGPTVAEWIRFYFAGGM